MPLLHPTPYTAVGLHGSEFAVNNDDHPVFTPHNDPSVAEYRSIRACFSLAGTIHDGVEFDDGNDTPHAHLMDTKPSRHTINHLPMNAKHTTHDHDDDDDDSCAPYRLSQNVFTSTSSLGSSVLPMRLQDLSVQATDAHTTALANSKSEEVDAHHGLPTLL